MNFPVSSIQKQFYINNMMYPKDTSYLIPSVFKINGRIRIDSLEKSINSIVANHEILRSFYLRKGNQVFQSFIDKSEAIVKVEQVFLPSTYKGIEFTDLNDEIYGLFKLDVWPLFRVKLFLFEDEVSILAITFHHIIIDLHSKIIFGDELSYYYNRFVKNVEIGFQDNNNSYTEFAIWEKEWLGTEESDKMLHYWKNHLKGSDFRLELPSDFERPSVSTRKGKRIYFSLDDLCTDQIQSFGKKISMNTFVILLSAYALMCHRLSKQDHVIVGVPVTNRRKQQFKKTFGPLLNIVPIHVNFSAIDNEEDLLRQVRISLLQAHRNQEVPFLFLLEKIEFKKSFSRNPIFQVGFTSEPSMELNFEGLKVSSMVLEKLGSQLDLFFTFWEKEDEIHVLLEYSSDLFTESTIRKWIKNYKDIVMEIASS